MNKILKYILTITAVCTVAFMLPTQTKAATYEEMQQAAINQYHAAIVAQYQATLYQQALQTQAAQIMMMANGAAVAQSNAMDQYYALKAAQATQLAQYQSMMQAQAVNQTASFAETYQQEQQRAMNAYLGYWGLK